MKLFLSRFLHIKCFCQTNKMIDKDKSQSLAFEIKSQLTVSEDFVGDYKGYHFLRDYCCLHHWNNVIDQNDATKRPHIALKSMWETNPLTAQTVQWGDSCCIPGSHLAPCQVLFWRKWTSQKNRKFMSESCPLLSVTSHCYHSCTRTSNPKPRLATRVAILGSPVCKLRWRVQGRVERVEGSHWVVKNINSERVITIIEWNYHDECVFINKLSALINSSQWILLGIKYERWY